MSRAAAAEALQRARLAAEQNLHHARTLEAALAMLDTFYARDDKLNDDFIRLASYACQECARMLAQVSEHTMIATNETLPLPYVTPTLSDLAPSDERVTAFEKRRTQ